MKARKRPQPRAQPQRPKSWNPLDDPATFERIDELLGALSRDPVRFGEYELTAPQEERDLICLYATLQRPKDARSGVRHSTACILSLSWQYPEHYGPTAPPDVRRSNHIQAFLSDAPPATRTK
jgi:hypothetical protein